MASNFEPDRNPDGCQKLNGSERPRAPGAQLQIPLDANEQVSATLVLRHKPGSPALPDDQHWQNTPLGERRFLSPEEYAGSYGAAQSDLDAVVSFVAANSMSVLDIHAGRRTVSISGTAAQMNAAFGIKLNRYESPLPKQPRHTDLTAADEMPARTHFHRGYDGPVHLPAELAGIVTAVVGLDNRILGGPGGSSGDPPNSIPLAVPAVAGLYNFPNCGAADQTIGVIAPSDPAGTTNPRVAGYLKNDINNLYFPKLTNANYRKTPASLNDINLTVGTNTYSNNAAAVQAVTSANLGSSSNSFILEVTQDISTAATVAQGAAVNVYFTEITEQGMLVCLNRILLPEGENQPTVVTCSFYFYADDAAIGSVSDTASPAYLMSSLFQQLALMGISVFIIAGDLGSDDGVGGGGTHVNYPGSDPWVTSCGGTVIGSIENGPPLTFDEYVWSNVGSQSHVGGFGGASGGGASATFPVPAYQTSASIISITDSQGNKSSNRFIPDVAGMVAYGGVNGSSGDWFWVNGNVYNFIGTSCVAPLYAGLAAVLRSAFGIAFGLLNPTLYQLGNNACNDVTTGDNDPGDGTNAPYYTAGAGWDACSGWGSIDGTKLLDGVATLMYNQTFCFQVANSAYGLDEVGVIPNYSPAFWLVLEGVAPAAVAGVTPKVIGAFAALSGVSVTVGAPQPENSSQPGTPQRILYPCSVDFEPAAINTVADGGVFPAPGAGPFCLPLTALTTIGGQIFRAATVFALVAGADLFFTGLNSRRGTSSILLS